MTSDRIQRALAEATREARNEPVPDIDWEGLDNRLRFAPIDRLPLRRVAYRPLLLAAACVLGAVGVGIGLARTHGPAAPAVATRTSSDANAGESTELDGDLLAPGTRVVAGDVARTVTHRGHATWTVAPHGSVLLLAHGDLVTIRLESGSVTSRVVKSSRVETFAVEAADVRIAAHGTAFVVTLGADGVSVSVTEGTVLVGPREEPGTGELLTSPASKSFTRSGVPRATKLAARDALGLDALRPSREDEASSAESASGTAANPANPALGVVVEPKARPLALGPSAQHGQPAPAPAESFAPEQASTAAVAGTLSEVVKLAASCFKQRTATSDGVRVMAQTIVTFRTQPDGTMKSVSFDPPLSPWVQVCVNASMSAIHGEATRYGFQASRTVNLER